jgi:hypothetical protein
MKRIFFVVLLIVLSSAIYGQESRTFTTSEGYWSSQIQYIGKNKAIENVIDFGMTYSRIERLSNNQLDYVSKMLDLYQRSSGDTFYLTLSFWPLYWDRSHPFSSAIVVVEYNTNTDWRYWAFNILNPR